MDTLSPLILLHGNGYKALAATNGSDDSRPVTAESQGKAVRVGEGDLDVKVTFADRNDEIGDLGRSFNHMVQQLRDSHAGRNILESKRPDGLIKFDRRHGYFGAYDSDGTIRTFFIPPDGIRYFERQSK